MKLRAIHYGGDGEKLMMGRGLLRHCAAGPRAMRLRESGYSLVEMVVVVSIILIMAMFAIPLMSNVSGYFKLRGAVSSISGAIQANRYQAIYQGVPYQVTFDATAKTYQVLNQPGGTGAFVNVCPGTLTSCPASWAESSGSTTLDATITLAFYPGGRVQNATTATPTPCPCTLTVTYPGKTPEVITVSNYGSVNVKP